MLDVLESRFRRAAAAGKPFWTILAVCLLGGCTHTVTARPPVHPVLGARAEVVEIPRGHMPPPGRCRIWFPGSPPGHQPPPGGCKRLERSLPSGAWLLYRPTREPRVYRID